MSGVAGKNQYAKAADFRSALRRFLRTSENAARAAGITPNQHLLLLQIAGCENAATISGLVERLALTQSAVTELVQRAELAGLVERTPCADDGRVTHLSLTAAGQAKLAEVHDVLGTERTQLRRVVDALD